jgi:NTP pyrophosphatase (non-canonical NTP hydrolase)
MDFDKYQWEAEQTCLSSAYNLEYLISGMAGEVGEVASLYAKYKRDGTKFTDLQAKMTKELGDVLWFVAVTAAYVDADLKDIAEANIQKLNDRQKRGKIGGSGDDR